MHKGIEKTRITWFFRVAAIQLKGQLFSINILNLIMDCMETYCYPLISHHHIMEVNLVICFRFIQSCSFRRMRGLENQSHRSVAVRSPVISLFSWQRVFHFVYKSQNHRESQKFGHLACKAMLLTPLTSLYKTQLVSLEGIPWFWTNMKKGLLCQVKKLGLNHMNYEKPLKAFKQRNNWSDMEVRSFW